MQVKNMNRAGSIGDHLHAQEPQYAVHSVSLQCQYEQLIPTCFDHIDGATPVVCHARHKSRSDESNT